MEDYHDAREVLSRLLSYLDYDVLEARSAEEALEIFGQRGDDIDIVISDRDMPGLNGLVLLRELRTRRAELKLILMSGNIGMEDRRFCEALGAATLQKPFKKEDLIDTIAYLFNLHR